MKKTFFFKKTLLALLMLALLSGLALPSQSVMAYQEPYIGAWSGLPKSNYSLSFNQTPKEGEQFILSSANQYLPAPGPSGTAGYPVYPDANYNWVYMDADNPQNTTGQEGWFIRGWNYATANAPEGAYPISIHNASWTDQHVQIKGFLESGYTDDSNAWWTTMSEFSDQFFSWKSTVGTQKVTGSKGTNIKFEAARNLVLYCHHITVMPDLSMPGARSDYDQPVTSTNNIKMTVLKVDTANKTALIHAMVPTASTQAGDVFLNFKYELYSDYDPVGILLQKKDAETQDGIPQAGLSLEGAQYTLRFYEGKTTASGTPSHTWVFKTDANGYIKYDDSHKVSGPALLSDSNGKFGFPVGVLTMQETKAPAGYKLNNAVATVKFALNASGQVRADKAIWNTTSQVDDLTVDSPEPANKIKLTVKKEASGEMSPTATLNGIRFVIVSRNASSEVKVGDKIYSGDDTILEVLEIKNAGNASSATVTSVGAFPAGNYRVYEIRQDATYKVGDTWDDASEKHGSSNNSNDHFTFATNLLNVSISNAEADAGEAKNAGTASNKAISTYFEASLKKVDENGTPIQGVQFNLKYGGQNHVQTTDAKGEITWRGIPWSAAGVSATLIETAVPTGYKIDPAYASPGKSVSLKVSKPGETYNLGSISNGFNKVKVSVTKQADETSKDMPADATLDGIRFVIVSWNGSKQVKIGSHDYSGNNTVLEVLEIKNSGHAKTATVTSTNSFPAGSYRIYEIRSDASYQPGDVWDSTGAKHGSSRRANDHFSFATNQLNFTISGEDADAGTVKNAGTAANIPTPRYFSAAIKKVDSAGNPVKGVKFNLRYNDTDHVGTTDDKGVITWTNIPWDKDGVAATLTETSVPAGYQINPAYAAPGKRVTLKTADPDIIYDLGTVINAEQTGKVIVQKKVQDVPFANKNFVDLSGFTFRLTGTSILGKTVNVTATTNAEGKATFENVPYGTNYKLAEELTSAQKKLWKGLANDTVDVNAASLGTAGYVMKNETNEPWFGSLTIKKLVPKNTTDNGAGFNFRVYSEPNTGAGYKYDKVWTTGADGSVTIENLPYGKYIIEEQLTAEQTKIWKAKSAGSVTVDENHKTVTFTLENEPKEANVTLKKTSEDKKVAGFKFTLSGTKAIGGTFTKEGTTDANGEINFGMVP